jgi:hypothetical protein
MNWELIISICALVISAITAVYSYLQGRKSNSLQQEQTELQRRVVNLEEKREKDKQKERIKADVKAEVVFRKTAKGKRANKLRIYNEGAGAAENVRIKINEDPITECNFIITDQDSFDIIAPGSDIKLTMATSFDSPPNWKTEVFWNDKTGMDNKFETILTQ